MNNLKRFTICKVRNHKWAKISYQPHESGTAFFLRCQRCGKENHDVSAPGVRPTWL
jgi:hypothetical protein